MSLSGFTLGTILYSILAFNQYNQNTDCQDIKVEFKILSKADGNEVKIIPTGGKKPYRIIFFEPNGKLLSEDFKRQSFAGIPSGDYTCVIIDGRNCRKSVDFNVPWLDAGY